MGKAIVFDLYDTVLKDISFDFNKGIIYLYNTFFSEVCSLKEMTDYAETFLPMFDKRKIDYSEVCLCKDEIPLYFEKFEVPKPRDIEKIDYAVMNQMQKVTLTEEVRYTLEELDKRGINMYILSNSFFSENSTRKLLNDFGILHYFKKVCSSADYGVRKPDSRFYQIVINEIMSSNPEMKKENILYVGNDYVTDVMGATSNGLKTVWYNTKHLPNENGISIFDIDDFRDILELIE